MKKITLALIFIILLLSGINYFKPLSTTELIKAGAAILPTTITAEIFFSSQEQKELTVTDAASIQAIMDFLGSIKVRKILISPDSYHPKLKNTYNLALITDNSEVEYINIFDNNYLELSHKTYRVVGSPDLTALYELIVSAQPAGSLDQFYYELIKKNE